MRFASGRGLLLVLLLALGLAAGAVLGWRMGGPPELGGHLPAIRRAAARAGVDPALLAALVAVESGGRADALSPRGARGLLQLLPTTAAEQAARLGLPPEAAGRLEDPETNLTIGAAYLARLLQRFGGEEAFALAAYNAGPTAVARWRERAPHLAPLDVVLHEGYAETRAHVVKVLRWRRQYAAPP